MARCLNGPFVDFIMDRPLPSARMEEDTHAAISYIQMYPLPSVFRLDLGPIKAAINPPKVNVTYFTYVLLQQDLYHLN